MTDGTEHTDPLRHRLWQLVALVTGLLVALGTVSFLLGHLATDRTTSTRTLDHPIRVLRIDNSGGSVSIDRGADGRAVLREDLSWVLQRPRIERHWEGDTLVLSVGCDAGVLGGGLVCSATIEIEVPAGTEVQLTGGSGSTTVSGLTGRLDLRSRSGAIQLNSVTGPVVANSTSGPIDGTGLLSPQISAHSSSGPISLTFAGAPRMVDAGTDSGPIDLNVPHGGRYRATAHSGSGPASVQDGLADAASAQSLNATSGSGPVDISYGN